jgi:hypothetical protein
MQIVVTFIFGEITGFLANIKAQGTYNCQQGVRVRLN